MHHGSPFVDKRVGDRMTEICVLPLQRMLYMNASMKRLPHKKALYEAFYYNNTTLCSLPQSLYVVANKRAYKHERTKVHRHRLCRDPVHVRLGGLDR